MTNSNRFRRDHAPWEIGKPMPKVLKSASKLPVSDSSTVARQLNLEDIKADYIIGMDQPNIR